MIITPPHLPSGYCSSAAPEPMNSARSFGADNLFARDDLPRYHGSLTYCSLPCTLLHTENAKVAALPILWLPALHRDRKSEAED